MKTKVRHKAAAVLVGGSLMFGFGGNCVPDNFWVNTWGGILDDTVDVAVATYVWPMIEDFIVPADEE
jgi:hypothetical protein